MRTSSAPLLLAIAAALLAGCGKKAEPAPPTPKVVVATPLKMTVVDWDDYVGQFVAVDSVDIRPRVSGYLQTVGFKDGDVVHQGQVLFTIDPRPYQAALDQAKGQEAHAQAALQNARTEAVRGQSLLDAKAISQQALDTLNATQRQAAADLVAAQAAVRSSQLNLTFTRVTAPMNGRVSDRRIAPGNLVTADTTVLTNIVNLNPIRFAFTGSEALYLKFQHAKAGGALGGGAIPVEIRLQDEAVYRWKGRLDFVDNALDTGSGVIRGRAVVDNPTQFLTPGMFGHMRMLSSAPYPALLIPDAALVTDQTRQIVFVAAADGTVSQHVVEAGPIFNGLRIIRSGIGAGDRVVIDGVQRAKPGKKVDAQTGKIAMDTAGAGGANGYAPPAASTATAADDAR